MVRHNIDELSETDCCFELENLERSPRDAPVQVAEKIFFPLTYMCQWGMIG